MSLPTSNVSYHRNQPGTHANVCHEATEPEQRVIRAFISDSRSRFCSPPRSVHAGFLERNGHNCGYLCPHIILPHHSVSRLVRLSCLVFKMLLLKNYLKTVFVRPYKDTNFTGFKIATSKACMYALINLLLKLGIRLKAQDL